jgi:hypothetical protein
MRKRRPLGFVWRRHIAYAIVEAEGWADRIPRLPAEDIRDAVCCSGCGYILGLPISR